MSNGFNEKEILMGALTFLERECARLRTEIAQTGKTKTSDFSEEECRIITDGLMMKTLKLHEDPKWQAKPDPGLLIMGIKWALRDGKNIEPQQNVS